MLNMDQPITLASTGPARAARRWPRAVLPLAIGMVLALSALIMLLLVGRLDAQQSLIRRTMTVESHLQRVLMLTVDVETATRGFLLNKDPAFLDAAESAVPLLAQQMAQLRRLTADNPEQLAALARLDELAARRLAGSSEVRALALRQSAPAVAAIGDGRRLQDEIRAAVAAMSAAEQAQLAARTEQGAMARNALQATIVLSALLLWLLVRLWMGARQRLHQAREHYRHMFAGAANGMALIDAGGRIVRTNASYCAILGYRQGELEGLTLESLKHPQERAHARAELARLLREGGGEPVRHERRYLRRDSSEVWVRSTLSRSDDPGDGSPRILAVTEDISERIRNDELLRRSAVLVRNAGRMAAIDGWFLALPEGTLEIGPCALDLLGLSDAAPRALLELLLPGSRRALLRAVAACRRRGRGFDLELEARKPGGEPVALRVMGQAVDLQGKVVGIDGALQDITANRRQQKALRKSERRFRAAAQVTNDGIWDWELGSGRVWRSESMAALAGLAPGALGDDSASWQRLIHPDDRAAVEAAIAQMTDGAAEESMMEYRVRRTDGSYAQVLDKARVLRDERGRAVRIVGGTRDLTERKRIQRALMQMAASVPAADPGLFFSGLLRHLLDAVGADGGGIARRSADDPRHARTLAAFTDGVQIDNVDYVLAESPCAALLDADESVLADGLALQCPSAQPWPGVAARAYAGHRLAAADGSTLGFVFALFRRPIADLDVVSPVLRVFAARVSAELERLDGVMRLREQAGLLDHAREAIAVLGLDLRVRFWNRGAQAIYGREGEAACGASVLGCYLDEADARGALATVLEHGEWHGESRQRRADGSELTIEETWTLVRNHENAPHSILRIGNDVTEKRQAQDEIRRLAYYDTLTGLPNRRLFLDRLEQLCLRSARSANHGALLFIDMDNFKSLNDRHGHDAGDEFLRQTAQRLRDRVRAGDTVARLGGDEFVILLDNLGNDADEAGLRAGAVAASIIDSFGSPVELGALSHHATASIGVALVRDDSTCGEALLRDADQAMYLAKRSGRNTVRFAPPCATHDAGTAIP